MRGFTGLGLLIACLGAPASVFADEPKDDAVKKELDKLQGTWVCVSTEEGGKENNSERAVYIGSLGGLGGRFTVKGDRLTGRFEFPGTTRNITGPVKLRPATDPKGLDWTKESSTPVDLPAAVQGEVTLACYAAAGDTLKVGVPGPGEKDRPKGLKTAGGDKYVVLTYVRETAKEVDPKKLVGKWTPEDVPDGLAVTIEFTQDGKVAVVMKAGEKEVKGGGTYKLDGDKLTMVLTAEGKEKTQTGTIRRLTDGELVMVESGEESRLKRVGGAPAAGPSAADEKEAGDLLRRARLYAQGEDNRPTYIAKLQAVLKKYPGTAAAKEAKRLLDGLK